MVEQGISRVVPVDLRELVDWRYSIEGIVLSYKTTASDGVNDNDLYFDVIPTVGRDLYTGKECGCSQLL
jgi:hypothetical protein